MDTALAAEYSVDGNTVALYHFNDGSGENATDEVHVYNATFKGAGEPVWDASARFGSNSVTFDGVDDYIRQTTLLDTSEVNGTIEFWFRPGITYDGTGSQAGLVMKRNDNDGVGRYTTFQIMPAGAGANAGKIRFGIGDDSADNNVYSNTTTWLAGTWYHVAGTWGSTGMRLYINENQHQTGAFTGHMGDGTATDFSIGDAYAAGQPFNGSIDEMRVSDIQRTTFEVDDAVTLDSPENTTYNNFVWVNSTTNFNARHCFAEVDSHNITMSNISMTKFYLKNDTLSVGSHYVDVWCNNTAGLWSNSSIIHFTINASIDILSPENKTYYTNVIPLNVSNATTISRWYYGLTNRTGHKEFSPNLTKIDGIGVGVWELEVIGTDSGGSNITQNITFTVSYIEEEDEKYHSEAYETEHRIFWLDLNIWNWTAVEEINVSFIFNGTAGNVTGPDINYNFTSLLFVPEVNNPNNVSTYWNYSVRYSDGTVTETNTTNRTMLIRNITVWDTSCSGTNIAFEIRGWNESNTTQPVNFTVGLTIQIGLNSKVFNFSLADNSTYRICIDPEGEEYVADVDIEYKTEGFDRRFYFLRSANITNQTTVINLYGLESRYSDEIEFTVQNTDYDDQENVISKAMRWFPELNQYLIVNMGLTGENGETTMFLEKNVYYRWVLERNGIVLKMTGPETLTGTIIMLYISVEDTATFFKYFDKVAYDCYDDEATNNFVCIYSDTSGILQSMTLILKELLLYNRTDPFCSKTLNTPSGVLVCSYSGYENETVIYSLKGNWQASPESISILDEGYLFLKEVFLWSAGSLGENGMLVTLIMVVSLFCLGLYNPSTSIFLGVVGLIVSMALGFFVISIGSLIGIIAASGFLMYRMRT